MRSGDICLTMYQHKRCGIIADDADSWVEGPGDNRSLSRYWVDSHGSDSKLFGEHISDHRLDLASAPGRTHVAIVQVSVESSTDRVSFAIGRDIIQAYFGTKYVTSSLSQRHGNACILTQTRALILI